MSYMSVLKLLVPETVIVVTALLVMFVDLTWIRESSLITRRRTGAFLATVGCVVAIWLLSLPVTASRLYDGILVIDSLGQLMKQILLVLTIFTAWLVIESDFTRHVGEFFALLLLATVGMMFLVSSENILVIFIALELLSLSLYVMTAFQKRSAFSAEAALKYFLFGGMSAAFLLFGLSLVYGVSNSTSLSEIAAALKGKPLDPLLLMAIVMVATGLGFKVAAVPFHLWAPDAYEGAPGPAAAFIASGSKVASFFVLAKVFMVGFAGAEGNAAWRQFSSGWMPLLAVIGLISIVLGNLTAIAQKSVRRLLAYSAIAQAGYMLVGLLANNQDGLASLLYYVTTYALTTLGAFGVVTIVQERAGEERFTSFAGLYRRAPMLAFSMLIFLLSLAGIPPLAGFFGKFYLFTAALGGSRDLGLLWLVIVAVAMSAVSLYYYLLVLKQIYVMESPAGTPPLRAGLGARFAVGFLALAVLVLGCLPGLLLNKFQTGLKALGL
ncbi:MAG: nuoN 2 [Verrucomicrobiales bacterium]|nr:nuoN 2 [Verrucomicrobiales bacterium]